MENSSSMGIYVLIAAIILLLFTWIGASGRNSSHTDGVFESATLRVRGEFLVFYIGPSQAPRFRSGLLAPFFKF